MFTHMAELKPVGFDMLRCAALLDEAGLGVAVITSPENVYYFTGYPALPTSGNPILFSLRNVFPHAVVVGRDGRRHLLCWDFSVQGVKLDVDEVVPWNRRSDALAKLGDTIASVRRSPAAQGSRRIGLEPTAPYFLVKLLEGLAPRGELVDLGELLLAMRRRKSPREIALLRDSVEIAERAVDLVLTQLEVGVSRLDVMRAAKRAVLDLGGDGVGHVTMSFGGGNPEVAVEERLATGALVVVDIGAKLAGYTSDCRGYGFAGPVPDVVAARHAAMCEVVDKVAEAMLPGTSFADLTDIARASFQQAGIPLLDRFTHVGHGIGLETEEEWIDDDPARRVDADMVVAVELYAEAPGYGTVGDEETYVIRRAGPERLTKLARAIREI